MNSWQAKSLWWKHNGSKWILNFLHPLSNDSKTSTFTSSPSEKFTLRGSVFTPMIFLFINQISDFDQSSERASNSTASWCRNFILATSGDSANKGSACPNLINFLSKKRKHVFDWLQMCFLFETSSAAILSNKRSLSRSSSDVSYHLCSIGLNLPIFQIAKLFSPTLCIDDGKSDAKSTEIKSCFASASIANGLSSWTAKPHPKVVRMYLSSGNERSVGGGIC